MYCVLTRDEWYKTINLTLKLSIYRTALANYTLTPHYYEITAGTILWQRTAGDQSQRRRVDKIVLHPKMRRLETGLTEWDLALFHIDFPLFYSDYLQPICLPEQDEVFPTNSQCYIAGWGYINPQEGTLVLFSIIAYLGSFFYFCLLFVFLYVALYCSENAGFGTSVSHQVLNWEHLFCFLIGWFCSIGCK